MVVRYQKGLPRVGRLLGLSSEGVAITEQMEVLKGLVVCQHPW